MVKVKKFLKWLINFARSFWTVRGMIALILTWLIFSGVGVFVVGVVLKSAAIKAVGLTIFIFWAGPFTPLMPIVMGVAKFIQVKILRDKKKQ